MTNHDEPNEQACWETVVYFARVGNYVKIGYTSHVPYRLVGVRCGAANGSLISPPDLPNERLTLLGTIPGNRDREADIHADLWEWQVVGEWFEATPFVLDFINDLVAREVAAA